MFSLNYNLMGGLIGTIFNKIFELLADVFEFLCSPIKTILDYLLKPFYVIFLGLCKLLDLFELIAKKLAGLDVVYVNGSAVNGDLTLSLLSSSAIWKAFTSMLALGSLLLFVTTFIAVIKSQMATGQRSSVKVVITNFIKTIINFTIVPALCFAGIYFGNALLKALDAATNQTGANTVSGALFICAAFDANRARDVSSGLMEDYLTSGSEYNTCNGMFAESGSTGTAATAIDSAFGSQITVDNCKLEFSLLHMILQGNPFAGTASMMGIYSNLIDTGETDEGFGKFFRKRSSGSITFTYYNVSLVCIYYNLASFNYVIGIGAGIMLLSAYFSMIFGLIKRLYTIVTLFVISPPIMALYPLDEGRAFNGWKQEFIANAVSAYSAVVVMNIYLMLMTVFQTVTLFADTTPASVSADELTYVEAAGIPGLTTDALKNNPATKALANLGISLANSICQMFIIIGGAMFMKTTINEVSRLIGARDAVSEGAQVAQKVKQTAKKAVQTGVMVAATGGAAIAAKGAATAAKAKALADKKKAYDALKTKYSGAKAEGGTEGASATANDTGANASANENQTSLAERAEGLNDQSAEVEATENQSSETTAERAAETEKAVIKQKQQEVKEQAKAEETKAKAEEKAEATAVSKPSSTQSAPSKLKTNKDGIPLSEISRIEKEYYDKVRAANAYNPIKNPIQARIRGMQEQFRGKYIMRGMSRMDQQSAYQYYQEISGRKEAIKVRTSELNDDIRVAKATGDKQAEEDARKRLDDYSRAVAHGLMHNDAYWSAEIGFQQQMTQKMDEMARLRQDLRMIENKDNSEDIKRQIAELDAKMSRWQRENRPDVNKF